MVKLPWIIQVVPKGNHKCSYKIEPEGDYIQKRRRPPDHVGRDGSDAVTAKERHQLPKAG